MIPRRPKPAPSSRPLYPRLSRAWHLLVAAAPLAFASASFADSTLPPTATKDKPVGKPTGDPTKKPQVRPIERPVAMPGGPAMMHYPEPPPQVVPQKTPIKPSRCTLHPHDPGDPCLGDEPKK